MLFRILALFVITLWAGSVWYQRIYSPAPTPAPVEAVEVTQEDHVIADTDSKQISDGFWGWEAQQRLELIDKIMDDERLVKARSDWKKGTSTEDVLELARYLTTIQNFVYEADLFIKPAKIVLGDIRGDANGVYNPTQQVVTLNKKMNWNDLPFERFVEVVFHENMHHIMTRMGLNLPGEDPLKADMTILASAAYFHGGSGLAQDSMDIYQTNPQEIVAWNTQRAARYAGIIGSDLSVWEMTTRTQEIRALTEDSTKAQH